MKRPLVLVCLLAQTAYADGPVVEKSRLDLLPPGKAFKQLSIDNPLGNVRVEGHDENSIVIITQKRAPDEDALDRLRVSLVPDPDGTVRLTTHADPSNETKPVKRSQVAIDIIIRAPRNARLDAVVGGGKLEVLNMDAGGELDSASGAIIVNNVQGELLTHSVSGKLSITSAFGSVDAATISSDVELDSITGDKLVASADKGKIAGRRVRSRDVELTTTSGKIVLEAEAMLRGRIVVSSLRGDVDIKVRRPMQTGLVVRARGTKVDLGAKTVAQGNWQEATFGSGGEAAMVEMRAPRGIVRFAVIQ